MRKVLIIDDDVVSCRLAAVLLRGELLDIAVANDAASGKHQFAQLMPDLVLLDMHLPDDSGLAVLDDIRRRAPLTPVIMLTADHDVQHVVEAIQHGATDYLTKPVTGDELPQRVRRAIATLDERELVEGGRVARARRSVGELFGTSEVARIRARQVELAAETDVPVLLTGESGTGKLYVAEAIHRASPRWQAPFIAIDCKHPPAWLVESELFNPEPRRSSPIVRGGTLFLGDVGSLAPAFHPKLLRLLDRRATTTSTLDLRVIAGSSKELAATFGPDLYFRLAQFSLVLPPLRGRADDIATLAQRFVEELARTRPGTPNAFEPGALALLAHHAWPGNVRELHNIVRQAALEETGALIAPAVIARLLEPAALGRSIDVVAPGRTLKEIAEEAAHEAERHAIAHALRLTRGNKSQASRMLKTDYKTLHLKMRALGIDARTYGDDLD